MRPPGNTTAITAALLAVTLAAAPVGAAKGDGKDMTRHLLAGAWLIDTTPQDTSDPLELLSFDGGGIVTNPGAGGLGSWRPTDKTSAEATILLPSTDPEAGFAGFITFRTNLEVATDGQSFSGTYTLQLAPGVVMALGGSPTASSVRAR